MDLVDDNRRMEAKRWMEISRNLLEVGDLISTKEYAERAIDLDPLADGVDEILAVSDVLLASQRRVNEKKDWYSILNLDSSSSLGNLDFSVVRNAYRRLALILCPNRNRHSGADIALRLVSEAWDFLSDPERKRLYDEEIEMMNAQSKPSDPDPLDSFWTLCPSCFRAYQYEKKHSRRNVRCELCEVVFMATELESPPPIVEGTELYYCTWGMFPLGFPGCPVFTGMHIPEEAKRALVFPQHKVSDPFETGMTRQKKAAKKPTKETSTATAEEDREVEIGGGSNGLRFDMNSFCMDFDTANGGLGNLHLLKDDEADGLWGNAG